jgi:hypothetical protein
VVPRVPANLAAPARGLQAFQRVRGRAPPHALVRGLLASVLGPLSTRRLGAWAGLIDLADISEAAWRKRLRTRNDWLLGLLGACLAMPAPSAPAVPRPAARRLLVEASCRRQPGGTGDAWRWQLADDRRAGRMPPVWVTARQGGAHLARERWPGGAGIVADRGDGSRRSVAMAGRHQAAVVVRLHPATFPLATEVGQPCHVLRWLRQRGSPERAWAGWGRWPGQRSRVGRVAANRDAHATPRARCRTRRQAPKAGRTSRAPPRAVASGRRRLSTLDAATWSAADVLYV